MISWFKDKFSQNRLDETTVSDDERNPGNALKKRKMLLVAIFLGGGAVLYFVSGQDKKREVVVEDPPAEMGLGSGLLKDTLGDTLADAEKKLEKTSQGLEERQSGVEKALAELMAEMERMRAEGVPAAGDQRADGNLDFPPAPVASPPRVDPFKAAGSGSTDLSGNTATDLQAGPPQPVVIGGIAAFQGVSFEPVTEKKSQLASVYLPPSYMQATLLTGLDALASQDGSENPEPVMLRVRAPAQLPNLVKSNLRGCFIVGSATGSLAKERVEIRLVSISCLDLNEEAVVEESIQGWVVDVDGKMGLAGRVHQRSGQALARVAAAGFLRGFGQVASVSSQVNSVSPLGVTQTFDPNDAALAGVGAGIGQVSEEASDYYLDLARQAVPVIEVGAAKTVYVFISKGIELKIRETTSVTVE